MKLERNFSTIINIFRMENYIWFLLLAGVEFEPFFSKVPNPKIFHFKLAKFPFSNCQNFSFKTVKNFLFKLSKFSISNCQNFPFQTVKNFLFKLSKFPFQTVKIFHFKLSKFSFPNCQKFPFQTVKFSFPNCQNFPRFETLLRNLKKNR